ncbi:DUF4142 domain-containing protein [Acidisoma sp. 7E03]
MTNRKPMRNRWLLSTTLGAGLLVVSAGAALAQNVPGENATGVTGPATSAATQTITLKPGQVAGTDTVLPADTAGNPAASMGDARFVMAASRINQAEIMMGQLAAQRGETQSERNYGEMLVRDHTQATAALRTIADPLRLHMASRPGKMEVAMYQQLQAAPAGQFDTMFNQAMIQGHEHAIRLFQMEATQGQSGALRSFAQENLPVLQRHLQVAQSLSPMASPAPMAEGAAPGVMPGTPGMAVAGQAPMMVPPGPATVNRQIDQIQQATSAPTSGNPDSSADQLNARVLTVTSGPS